MQLFLVRHWETEEETIRQTDGLYAVRAANQEDCAQFLLRHRESPKPGQETTDILKHIRQSVAKAKQLPLLGEFKHEKMVEDFGYHWNDFI